MSTTSEELVAAIHRAVDGDAILSPQLAVSVLEASRGAVSEEIEQEILLLLASGYSYAEIAARLHLPLEAIETHVSIALRRLI